MQLAIDQYELLSTAFDQSIQSLTTGKERLWENVQENIQHQTTLAGQLFAKELHQLQDILSKKVSLTTQTALVSALIPRLADCPTRGYN